MTVFSLGQVSQNKPLLEKIVGFLNSHVGDFYIKKDYLGIYDNAKNNWVNFFYSFYEPALKFFNIS